MSLRENALADMLCTEDDAVLALHCVRTPYKYCCDFVMPSYVRALCHSFGQLGLCVLDQPYFHRLSSGMAHGVPCRSIPQVLCIIHAPLLLVP